MERCHNCNELITSHNYTFSSKWTGMCSKCSNSLGVIDRIMVTRSFEEEQKRKEKQEKEEREKQLELRFPKINLNPANLIVFKCDLKTPAEVMSELEEEIKNNKQEESKKFRQIDYENLSKKEIEWYRQEKNMATLSSVFLKKPEHLFKRHVCKKCNKNIVQLLENKQFSCEG